MVASESAGDVTFSVDSISLSPSNPVEGDDVDFTVTLTNLNSSQISGVDVSLHPDSDQNTAFHQETVSISASSFVQVIGTWVDIPFGSHSVVLVVSHNGSTASVSKPFSAAGLVDLIASDIQLNPNTDLHQGDVVNISVNVSNIGNHDAPSSHLLIQLDGGLLSELSVQPLFAGTSTIIQTSFNAPAAGSHQIAAIANSANDSITESDTGNNGAIPLSFSVLTNPDYLHHQQPNPQITVTTSLDSLSGPWTLDGEILRMGGSGESTISIGIYRVSGETEISVSNFQLTFSDTSPLQSWQQILTTAELQSSEPGTHTLRVRIDPSRQVAQSIQFNDDLDTQIVIHPEPNVVVSPHASVSSDTVLSGEQVTFEVTVLNTGSLPVIGDLTATFDSNTLTPKLSLGIPAGEERTFTFQATAVGDENGVLQFIATWQANPASYDSASNDNTAFGSVSLRSDLRLRFLSESESWTPQHTPLVVGNTYTYTIEIVSEEGSGTETFTCLNHGDNNVLSSQDLNFSSPGSSSTVICSFKADKAGSYELYVIPDGSSVATWTTAWSISATNNDGESSQNANNNQATILFVIAGLLLIGVLIGAVLLSRTDDEEVERGTYEYCPSCDGEIEGDEYICPHCDFDLEEGLSQFHDCLSCGTNIPDMIEHCPYCGTVQDTSSFYEKRERKERVIEEVEEEVEEDLDEVVIGSDDYSDAIQDMGYDEEQLESHWDEHLSDAEREIDEAIAEREKLTEITEEDAEDELVMTQMRQSHESHRVDIDEMIGDKESRRHLQDQDVELSASDANIREDIYKITGEEGILPGEEVEVEFIPDNTVVGNELKDSTEVTDFTVEDEGGFPTPTVIEETGEETTSIEVDDESDSEDSEDSDDDESDDESPSKRRRSVRRRGSEDSEDSDN
jgi:RNA polymerase subunit RPABC4/transcription elongation factor Spt4